MSVDDLLRIHFFGDDLAIVGPGGSIPAALSAHEADGVAASLVAHEADAAGDLTNDDWADDVAVRITDFRLAPAPPLLAASAGAI